MTKKGVLHPDQNEFMGENEKIRRKDRKIEGKEKEKWEEKGEERRSSFYWSLVFEQ